MDPHLYLNSQFYWVFQSNKKILIFLFVWLKIWGIVFSHHGQGSWLNWYNMTCLPSTWKRGVVIRSDSSHSYFRQIILVLSLRLLKLCVLFYYDIKGLEFVHHFIEGNLFYPWYSCKIAHLALNNNHSPV
jgi:hypothetical protein